MRRIAYSLYFPQIYKFLPYFRKLSKFSKFSFNLVFFAYVFLLYPILTMMHYASCVTHAGRLWFRIDKTCTSTEKQYGHNDLYRRKIAYIGLLTVIIAWNDWRLQSETSIRLPK